MSGIYKKIRDAGAEALGTMTTGPYDGEVTAEYIAYQQAAIRKDLPEIDTLSWNSDFGW